MVNVGGQNTAKTLRGRTQKCQETQKLDFPLPSGDKDHIDFKHGVLQAIGYQYRTSHEATTCEPEPDPFWQSAMLQSVQPSSLTHPMVVLRLPRGVLHNLTSSVSGLVQGDWTPQWRGRRPPGFTRPNAPRRPNSEPRAPYGPARSRILAPSPRSRRRAASVPVDESPDCRRC